MKPQLPAAKPQHHKVIAEWAGTLLLLVFGTATVAQPYVVPTGSMENTVLVGDHIIADKIAYAPAGAFSKHFLPYQEIRRGDIIVFRYPLDISETYVKRVIGVPGDHIRLEAKQLVLNGHRPAEPYTVHISPELDSYRDYFPAEPNAQLPPSALRMLADNVAGGELIVPPGYYFAMGDNRDNSSDSRYWGFVPRENIVAKPVLIYWSYDTTTESLKDVNFEHVKDIALHFFTKTRWDRTFQLVRGYPLE